ncbi:EF-P beta-lysylation protein EpmB [Stratiformator vulcanicus]|uniref:EF-P beta-lysylation protein EpmB n=1 Tax=Stratiformator vulcanicus TaxID=2527980 RepID=UPI002877516A|nr:EF-P beta-lysylation protein EpmB [Stratiformator vulcanicus]
MELENVGAPRVSGDLVGRRPAYFESLARSIRDPAELLRRLDLSDELLPAAVRGATEFPLLIPEDYLKRMSPGDPLDPLLRQVLPLDEEFARAEGFVDDPVGDSAARQVDGLISKYPGRVLLVLTGSCAVHCRYCFRRHYPYESEPRQPRDWELALETIRRDSTIHEVILSGGDPLMLTDTRLAEFLAAIEEIPHLNRLRIHSRLPIVLPDRVTDELIAMLSKTRLTPIVVVHANHPNEIAGACSDSLGRLVRSGITTLNQAVLLKGVNDSAQSLIELSERLIDLGVMPYYLHQLDRVRGAAHFEVSESTGRKLVAQMRSKLPGYAVPQYVREIAGEASKTPLF